MSLAKNEINSGLRLLFIKMKGTRISQITVLAVAAGIFLLNGLSGLRLLRVFMDGVTNIKLTDYATFSTVLLIIYVVSHTVLYRSNNKPYSMYPQTNTGRFLSEQLLTLIWIVEFAAASLILFLIQYSVYALISARWENVVLVYPFNLGFLTAGFFVFIVIMAIFASFVSLLGVIVRKFRIYSVVFFTAAFVLMLRFPNETAAALNYAFRFLIAEESPVLFFIKGIMIWIVLSGIALAVNRFTVPPCARKRKPLKKGLGQ